MAGLAPDFPLPNSSFFKIYTDGQPAVSTNLPGGPCNFVDLTHGANGPKCGCRRFWSRGAFGRSDRGSPTGYPPGFPNGFPYGTNAGLEDQAAWCMCSHHACFHDDIRDGQSPAPGMPNASLNINTNTNGQENERPRSNREPLTPVMPDLSFKMPAMTGPNMEFHSLNNAYGFSSQLPTEPDVQQSEIPAPAQGQSLPDTLSWSNLIQSDPDQSAMLPPIPSQCLMPSQPSSTTSSTRIGYLKPFSGKGLQTLSGVRSKLREALQGQDADARPQDEDTVAATDDGQTVINTPRSSRHTDISEGPSPLPTPGVDRGAFQLLSNTVHGHEQRIDSLENVSFSAGNHDICHEKHDNTDLRVTELESRVEEVEKMLNDNGSVASSHHRSRRPGIDETASSVVSVSTNGSSHMDRTELYSQLQSLRAQLSQLHGISSFACASHPWEVEVVFLPFPLKSVWMESRDFGSQRLSGGNNLEADPWMQLPISSPMDPQSPVFGDWLGPEVESQWLLARACAPDQTIEQRLRSRGLVKNVTVRGPDARSVQQAVSEAFGTSFRTFSRMQANVHHGSTMHQRVHKFLGLQSPWVPLRKIRKDSRLRFLSPAEMITPVTWDVQFLSSSVVMKSNGVQRLYITQPEAYLQDQDAYENGWSWQRLRELSRVYADSQSSQVVPEGDAKEECWFWNDHLDENAPSIPNSQPSSLRQAAQRNWQTASMPPSQSVLHRVMRPSPSLAARRSGSRAQSPAIIRERKASQPPRIRTASMPPTLPPTASPAQAKRRITSYVHPYERRPSPQVVRVAPPAPHVVALGKHRSTRSPSVRPRNRHTPRWSTASPSPIPEGFAARGTTPFYATPYSNAPFIDTRPNRGGVVIMDDGDIDLDYEQRGSGSDPYDGVEEDDDASQYDDSQMIDLTHPDSQHISQESWQNGQLPSGPEDEPWPGIEDAENRDPDLDISDDQGSIDIDIHVDQDAMTDGVDVDGFDTENRSQSRESSVPSEYPSTQWAWTGAEDEAPKVFQDGRVGDTNGQGQGNGCGERRLN